MENEIPISHASFSEVCARVAFRCIQDFYRHIDYTDLEPDEVLMECSAWLRREGFRILATWVFAYVREWSPMTHTRFIRDDMIQRSRRGYSWRRVAYPAYKSARRDPRVTNRGVTRRASIEGK